MLEQVNFRKQKHDYNLNVCVCRPYVYVLDFIDIAKSSTKKSVNKMDYIVSCSVRQLSYSILK